MIIDYAPDRVFTQSLDIVDAGNACVRCIDKEGVEYYIITKTIMGRTHVLKFGPIMPDMEDYLLNTFSVVYNYVEYKENKIEKEFKMFINDVKKEITEAVCVEPEEALPLIPNVAQLWENI